MMALRGPLVLGGAENARFLAKKSFLKAGLLGPALGILFLLI
jgi:hypothetical protein